MEKGQKSVAEFRYYEIPQNLPLIALLGEKWITKYGSDAMHFHNYLEIGYCYYGEGTMYLAEEEQEYRAGTITVIPKNFLHHTRGKGDKVNRWEYLFVDVERFLNEIFADKPGYAKSLIKNLQSSMYLLHQDEFAEVGQLLHLILEEMREKNEFYRESVRGLLLSLLLKIARVNAARGGETMPVEQKMADGNRGSIVEALDYIENHYNEEIKVGELAQAVHMSETHFRRIFTEYMKASPLEYVNMVRIEKACILLKKSNDKIEHIAYQVGFPIETTFIRNFKKIVGLSPKEWRREESEKAYPEVGHNLPTLKGW